MLGKGEQCGYESSCVLRKEFGEEICWSCTVGPREMKLQRKLGVTMVLSTLLNVGMWTLVVIGALLR